MKRTTDRLLGALMLSALILAGCGGEGSDGSASPAPPPQPPPAAPNPASISVQLSSGESTVNAASTVTLTWNSQGAASCQASGDWSGDKTIAGTQTVGPLFTAATFGLSCTGAGGSASQSVAIDVEPLVEFELRQGVVELDPAAAAFIVEIDNDSALFNAPVQLAVGTVFLHEGRAYKVTGVSIANGQMTVDLQEPALEEMFERVRLAGTLDEEIEPAEADGSDRMRSLGVADANDVVRLKCPSISKEFPLASIGGFSIGGKLNSRCSAVFDYEYERLGGIKKARFDVVLDASVGQGKFSMPPISVETTRALLPRPVSFAIPAIPGLLVSVMPAIKGNLSLGFFLESNWTAVFSADAGFDYSGSDTTVHAKVRNAGVTLVPQAVGVQGAVTGGLSGSALLAIQTDVSLDLLGWPLFGVRGHVGPGGDFTVSGPANDLCLKYQLEAQGALGGYVKGFDDELELLKEFSGGGGPGEFGNCAPPSGPPALPFSGTGTFEGSGTLTRRTESGGVVFECSADATSNGDWRLDINAQGSGSMRLTNWRVTLNGCTFNDFVIPQPATTLPASRDGDVVSAEETFIGATVRFEGSVREGRLEGEISIDYDPEFWDITGVIAAPITMEGGT